MALTPPPAAPQRGDRATFAQRVDAFITWLIGFVAELNIFSANLNSIAAGGAYAIPYTWSARGNLGTSGRVSNDFADTAQNTAGTLAFDLTSSAGRAVATAITSLLSGSSTMKGSVLVQTWGDPSKYLLYNINSISVGSILSLGVSCVGSSSANPFAANDGVMLFFQRTGDKGDAGSLTPVLWVRDEKASGVAGGSGIQDGYVVRTLNTAKKNSMSGASLAGNRITLPAGTFRVSFTAPAGPTASNHQAYLYNVTDGVTTVAGTSTYAPQSAQIVTVSQVLCAEFTISSSKVFEVRHWITATGTPNLGAASSSGQVEVYTDVFIEKVS